jgi:hypothetical protein
VLEHLAELGSTLRQAHSGIEYVVDINPRKAGRSVPGTAQKIVPPEYLRDYRPMSSSS